ncbi:MAG: trypsin-like peptidase domain-containing protein [Prochloraceae cyanobacterium]
MKSSEIKLLRHQTVKLQVGSRFGTGFVVTSELILTCFHVVREAKENNLPIEVWWENKEGILVKHSAPAVIEKLPQNTELVDLALLKLSASLRDRSICFFLDDKKAEDNEQFSAFGYTEHYPDGEPRTLIYEGLTGGQFPLITLREGNIKQGFSGSPLLNIKTLRICGIIKRTRDEYTDLGGRAIPTSTIFAAFPELKQQTITMSLTIPANPFIPLNGPVDDRKLFFNRDREINKIFEILNSGGSVALIGEKGIGKSSLLQIISQQAIEKLNPYRQPIYLNMGNVLDEEQFYFALCDLIDIPECKGYYFFGNLKKQKNKFLLILDEAENLQWEGFTNRVRGQIRALAQGNNAPLRLVIAANKPLNELFSDSGMVSPFENVCTEVKINPWQKDTIVAFIASRLESDSIQFNKKEIEDIITKSQGHPRQVMKLCNQLYSSKTDNQK